MMHLGLPAILNKTELRFIAQPILDQQGDLFGHEILLRFKHFESPAALLKIVRHLDLRPDLDLDVCMQAAELIPFHNLEGCWNLNLFANSLLRDEVRHQLVAMVDQLGHHQLLLDLLELEQTSDMPHLRKAMALLHDAGIQFALDVDDMENPCSQLLPFQLLRMDVRRTPQPMWERWLEEARIRDLPLLAYRVENEQQLLTLSELGADYLQGYAVRESVPLEPELSRF